FIREVTKLVHSLEVPEEVGRIAGVTAADGVDTLAGAVTKFADEVRARVIQVEIVQIDSLSLDRPIRRPGPHELLTIVRGIKVAPIHDYRLHPERIHIELLAVPIGLDALEGTAGVCSGERGKLTRRKIEELLADRLDIGRIYVE